MASCYSGAYSDTRQETLKLCSYLPIVTTIAILGEEVEIQLTVFQTDKDFEQGMTLMNDVILEGKTWPFLEIYTSMDEYKGYFHSHASFAVKFVNQEKYGNAIIGCFYVKPNFPGRCSHICNGGFITNPSYRGLGVATFMGEHFKRIAKDLGYRSSLFNLVFASNAPSVKVWSKLGFKHIATIPKAAKLVGHEGYVDANQFYCDFYETEDPK